MTPVVVAVVLVAAVTHASWNAIAHHIGDQLVASTLVGLSRALCGAALVTVFGLPGGDAWPYLLVSAGLHVVYQIMLMRSFTLGDFGQTYPIARGTAPIVVTVLAALLVGERLTGWAALGLAVASAGLLGLALWGVRGGVTRPRTPAIVAAVGTGLAISAYTVVDGVGIRAADSAAGYIAWLVALDGLAIPGYAFLVRRADLAGRLRPFLARGLLGGVLSVVAYGLVLWAQARAPLAPVAVLRESSIIVGAAIGAVLFKEPFGGPRTVAAGFMVAGIALMLVHPG